MSQKVTSQATLKNSSNTAPTQLPNSTFIEHVRELQSRLFSIVLAFVIFAAIAYPFFDRIVEVLLAPLGKDQQLVYLTPGGAFGFIIMVCVYAGIIGALPVIIFHVYRFLMPAVRIVYLRSALKFTVASVVLAVMGIVFAYYVSLPASLYFLTGFNLYHINPMLTIDSYFSFVMTYLLAGALLFQLPLIMLIINGVTPLTPRKLMGYQRHMIVGSFVVAAVISPTPDALNQTLLASPLVVMYQLGILIIWRVNVAKSRRVKARQQERIIRNKMAVRQNAVAQAMVNHPSPVVTVASMPALPAIARPVQAVRQHYPHKSIDGMNTRPVHRRDQPVSRMIAVPKRQSIDGIIIPNRV